MADKIYVVDTNVILQDIQNVKNLSQDGKNIVVVPETVMLELEDKKRQINELGFQAREFARFIADSKVKEVDYQDGFKIVKLYNNQTRIHFITKDNYQTQIEINHFAESNDKRIIEVAQIAHEYYKGCKVSFLSLDVYARIFSLFKGIKAETLRDDKSIVPQNAFFKAIQLNNEISLDGEFIKEIDENYESENFCYEFARDNGIKEYGIIYKEKIHLITELDFKGMKVKPVNIRQKFFMKAMLSNLFEIIIVDAKAGSGKTLLAVASAMKLIDKGYYDKIVYVRNSIESLDKGADIGYLSGNEEKFRIYNLALYDTLEFIAKKILKKTENKEYEITLSSKIDELFSKYRIEKLWPGEARGRTLSDAIVIMDEWQNSSENTTQMILSRLDNSCMAIVIGSNRQIDNPYLNKYNNGLTSLLRQTSFSHEELSMFAIELKKAVRGKFAEFSERIYDKSIHQNQ